MKRISNAEVGIQTGDTLLFSAFDDGGEMWTGHGSRLVRHRVQFSQPFAEQPSIHVSMSMVDMDNATNQRADLQAVSISREGFEIQFRTWGDTRVARVRASWMAIGPVAYRDNWDVE